MKGVWASSPPLFSTTTADWPRGTSQTKGTSL
jgi:hypothetical protein